MNQDLNSTQKLALEISSCGEVCSAFKDKSHPCRDVVNWQVNEWNTEIQQIPGSVMHRPEAWTGNLSKAPIVFLASNPSFDRSENFPSWDKNIWTDEEIADFGANRFTLDVNRKYGAIDSRTFDQQDRTIRLDGTLSEKVDHWMWVRKYASLILDKEVTETSAIEDFVMTELVHCKSPSEEGVMQALSTCSEKWFEKVMFESPAKLIVVAGAKAGEAFARIYAEQIPESWGSWANSKVGKGKGFWPKSREILATSMEQGLWTYSNQLMNSTEIEVGGAKRLAIYIARPNRGAAIYAPWAHPNLISPELIKYWQQYLNN